jgi:hypothetical protein
LRTHKTSPSPLSLFPRPALGRFQLRSLLVPAYLFCFRLLIERGAGGGAFLRLDVVGLSGGFELGISLRGLLFAALPLGFLRPLPGGVPYRAVSRPWRRRRPTSEWSSRRLCRRRLWIRREFRRYHLSAGQILGRPGRFAKSAIEPTARLRTTPGLAIVAAMISGLSDSFAKP